MEEGTARSAPPRNRAAAPVTVRITSDRLGLGLPLINQCHVWKLTEVSAKPLYAGLVAHQRSRHRLRQVLGGKPEVRPILTNIVGQRNEGAMRRRLLGRHRRAVKRALVLDSGCRHHSTRPARIDRRRPRSGADLLATPIRSTSTESSAQGTSAQAPRRTPCRESRRRTRNGSAADPSSPRGLLCYRTLRSRRHEQPQQHQSEDVGIHKASWGKAGTPGRT